MVTYAPPWGAIIASRRDRVLDILDYATSRGQKTSIRSGSKALNDGSTAGVPRGVWADALADAVSLGQRTIYIPGGTYTIYPNTALDNNTDGVGNAIIGEPGKTTITKQGTGNAFQARGTSFVQSSHTLASNVAAGDMTITLTAGHGASFAVDTYAVLVDESTCVAAQTGPKKGEFVRIRAIAGDVLSLWHPVLQTFATASTAQLCTVSLTTGVEYRDLNVVMDSTITILDSVGFQEAFGFLVSSALNPKLMNLSGSGGVHAFIYITGVVDPVVDLCMARDFGSTTSGSSDPVSSIGLGGFGYGVRCDGLVSGGVVSRFHAKRIRHLFTTGGGYPSTTPHGGGAYDAPDLSSVYGMPLFTRITDSEHYDALNASFDTHSPGHGIVFQNCHAINGALTGFQLRSKHTRVLNCTSQNMIGPHMWIRGGASSGVSADSCHVTGFTGYSSNLALDSVLTGLDWREYGAICDEAFDTVLNGIRITSSGGPIITTGRNAVGRRISYRAIEGQDICLTAATNKYAIDIEGSATGANILIDGLEVRDTGAKVTDLVRRAVSTTAVRIRGARGYGYTGNLFSTADASSDVNVSVTDSDGPAIQERRGVRLYDDFSARTISANWLTNLGSDGACATAILSGAGGSIRMTTGANAAGTMATNACRIEQLAAWSLSVGTPISLEVRLRTSAITNVAVYLGFTQAGNTLNTPFVLSGADVLTASAGVTDAVGVLFDSAAATQQWCMSSIVGSAATVKAFSGLAIVAATYERWRVYIAANGDVSFFRNGDMIGSARVGAVGAASLLAPVISCYARAALSRTIDVDYIEVSQG